MCRILPYSTGLCGRGHQIWHGRCQIWFSGFFSFSSHFVSHGWSVLMMKITDPSHLSQEENLHNQWLSKYLPHCILVFGLREEATQGWEEHANSTLKAQLQFKPWTFRCEARTQGQEHKGNAGAMVMERQQKIQTDHKGKKINSGCCCWDEGWGGGGCWGA